jgi:hypothetical protein
MFQNTFSKLIYKYPMYKIIIILSLLITSCTPISSVRYVDFGIGPFPEINSNKIEIYNNILDIQGKYVEVGVVIVKGEISIEEILSVASQHGANGVIKDGKNYLLLNIHTQPSEGINNDQIGI